MCICSPLLVRIWNLETWRGLRRFVTHKVCKNLLKRSLYLLPSRWLFQSCSFWRSRARRHTGRSVSKWCPSWWLGSLRLLCSARRLAGLPDGKTQSRRQSKPRQRRAALSRICSSWPLIPEWFLESDTSSWDRLSSCFGFSEKKSNSCRAQLFFQALISR